MYHIHTWPYLTCCYYALAFEQKCKKLDPFLGSALELQMFELHVLFLHVQLVTGDLVRYSKSLLFPHLLMSVSYSVPISSMCCE